MTCDLTTGVIRCGEGSDLPDTVEIGRSGTTGCRFHDLVEALDVIIWEADAETWQFLFVSQGAEALLGYPVEQWGTRDFWITHLHPADRERADAVCRTAVRERKDCETDFRMIAADGRVVWLRNILRVAPVPDGRPHLVRGVMVDITARKQAQEALRQSEERLRAVVSAAPIVLFALDEHGVVTLSEGRGLTTLGLAPGEAVGQSVFDVYRDAPQMLEAVNRALAGENFSTIIDMNGLVLDCRYSAQRDAEGRVTGVIGVGTDVTERKRIEAVLQEEGEGSAALVRVGQEIVSSLDTPVLLNRLCQLTTEILGCDYTHTLLWRPEEHAYAPVAGHGNTPEEWESIRLLRIPRAPLASWFASLEREDVRQESEPLPQEHTFARLAQHYGITVSMYLPLRRGGKMIGYLAAGYRGRTEPFTRKQERLAVGIAHLASMALENARLVEELGRANRLKSDVVAILAHELRTPLNAIMGYTDLLLEGEFGPLNAEQAEISRRVDRITRVLRDLVNATMDISRLDAGQPPVLLSDVDLSDLIAEIGAETRELRTKPGVNFRWDIPAQLPRLYTDPLKVKVILKNLIGNAIKFTAQGQVTVTAQCVHRGVEFRVSDTGIGIPVEARSYIFEPFRQADGSGAQKFGGVGLGLYLVRRLVDVLGGTIEVESQVGEGSTFRAWLPLRSVAPARAATATRPVAPISVADAHRGLTLKRGSSDPVPPALPRPAARSLP